MPNNNPIANLQSGTYIATQKMWLTIKYIL